MLKVLRKVLNFAVRVIFGRRKHDHIADVLRELGWIPVTRPVDYFDLRMMHNINPRPFSVFRHLPQWRGGGDVGATPLTFGN